MMKITREAAQEVALERQVARDTIDYATGLIRYETRKERLEALRVTPYVGWRPFREVEESCVVPSFPPWLFASNIPASRFFDGMGTTLLDALNLGRGPR